MSMGSNQGEDETKPTSRSLSSNSTTSEGCSQGEEIFSACSGPKPCVRCGTTGEDPSSAPSPCEVKAAASSIPPLCSLQPTHSKTPSLAGWFQTKPELMLPRKSPTAPKDSDQRAEEDRSGVAFPSLSQSRNKRFGVLLPAQLPRQLQTTTFGHHCRCKPSQPLKPQQVLGGCRKQRQGPGTPHPETRPLLPVPVPPPESRG